MAELGAVLENASNNTAGVFSLSGETLAVLFFALSQVQDIDVWRDFPDEPLTDSEIDQIVELVDWANDELMREVSTVPVGAIMMWLDPEPPPDWFWLDGQGLDKLEYPELYALYGGRYADTTQYFGLPNWLYKSPFGITFVEELDTFAGSMTHALTEDQMPAHVHRVPKQSATVNAGVNVATPAARTDNTAAPHITTDPAGGNEPFPILHPVAYCMYIVYAGKKAV